MIAADARQQGLSVQPEELRCRRVLDLDDRLAPLDLYEAGEPGEVGTDNALPGGEKAVPDLPALGGPLVQDRPEDIPYALHAVRTPCRTV